MITIVMAAGTATTTEKYLVICVSGMAKFNGKLSYTRLA